SDLIPQSRAFQHGLKESLRARDTESDVAFTKFRDERPQFVCRRRINSPRGFSVVKKESERLRSSADEREHPSGEVFNVVEDERRFEPIDDRARHGPRVWVTGDIIVAVESGHQAENGFTRMRRESQENKKREGYRNGQPGQHAEKNYAKRRDDREAELEHMTASQ